MKGFVPKKNTIDIFLFTSKYNIFSTIIFHAIYQSLIVRLKYSHTLEMSVL